MVMESCWNPLLSIRSLSYFTEEKFYHSRHYSLLRTRVSSFPNHKIVSQWYILTSNIARGHPVSCKMFESGNLSLLQTIHWVWQQWPQGILPFLGSGIPIIPGEKKNFTNCNWHHGNHTQTTGRSDFYWILMIFWVVGSRFPFSTALVVRRACNTWSDCEFSG